MGHADRQFDAVMLQKCVDALRANGQKTRECDGDQGHNDRATFTPITCSSPESPGLECRADDFFQVQMARFPSPHLPGFILRAIDQLIPRADSMSRRPRLSLDHGDLVPLATPRADLLILARCTGDISGFQQICDPSHRAPGR